MNTDMDDCSFYKSYLLEHVMKYWLNSCDGEAKGYITSFDRQWKMTDDKKYMWLQAKQAWTFSAMYRWIERDRKWISACECGMEFILRYGRCDNGRWNYCLDRNGKVLTGPVSIFSDFYVMEALAAYIVMTGRTEYLGILSETCSNAIANIEKKGFRDLYPYGNDNTVKRLGIYSVALISAMNVRSACTGINLENFIRECIDSILNLFFDDERQWIYEEVSRTEGNCARHMGVMNPGHAMQTIWAIIEEGIRTGDDRVIKRVVNAADWVWEKGYDHVFGGFFAFCTSGTEKASFKGIMPEEKIWWANAEALYTIFLIAGITRQRKWMDRLKELHHWCFDKFCDPKYGEWYTKLNRTGWPVNTAKGNSGEIQKCACHLPRALIKIVSLT